MRRITLVLAAMTAVVLTACGGGGDADPGTQPGGGGEVAEGLPVEEARQQLAERLDVDAERLQVAMAERVQWPDTAIGCPEEGKMYAQQITDGYRIILMVDHETYAFHGREDGPPQFCDDPQEPVGATGPATESGY